MKAKELKGLSEKAAVAKVGPLFTTEQEKSGILACVSLAQFILESGYGSTGLAQQANNCFGMKASLSGNSWASVWDGKSICTMKTNEQKKNGTVYTITADFRKYDSIEQSIADHSAYLLGAMNGKKLRYEGLKGCTDYKKAFQIIKDGGYATAVDYVPVLCEIVERWNLAQYNVKPVVKKQESIYRVRRVWADVTSQLGAFTSLNNAKTFCQKHEGYFVYTDKGIPVYPIPFSITILNKTAYYAKDNGTSKAGTAAKGSYTIVEVNADTGYGKLKSGAGWIPLNECIVRR